MDAAAPRVLSEGFPRALVEEEVGQGLDAARGARAQSGAIGAPSSKPIASASSSRAYTRVTPDP